MKFDDQLPSRPRKAPRLVELRETLCSRLPPEAQPGDPTCLTEVLFSAILWGRRSVPARPRQVTEAAQFAAGLTAKNQEAVGAIAAAIRNGDDLTPYLSGRATRLTRRSRLSRRISESKPGKAKVDFALEAYGVHHLHLSPKRSDELVFVVFGREDALLLMLGDHKSFDSGAVETAITSARAAVGSMTLQGVVGLAREYTPGERQRLARSNINCIVQVGDEFVLSSNLSSAGTSLEVRRLADRMCDNLEQFERQLEGPQAGLLCDDGTLLHIADPEWLLVNTDLCIRERNAKNVFLVVPGLL